MWCMETKGHGENGWREVQMSQSFIQWIIPVLEEDLPYITSPCRLLHETWDQAESRVSDFIPRVQVQINKLLKSLFGYSFGKSNQGIEECVFFYCVLWPTLRSKILRFCFKTPQKEDPTPTGAYKLILYLSYRSTFFFLNTSQILGSQTQTPQSHELQTGLYQLETNSTCLIIVNKFNLYCI